MGYDVDLVFQHQAKNKLMIANIALDKFSRRWNCPSKACGKIVED